MDGLMDANGRTEKNLVRREGRRVVIICETCDTCSNDRSKEKILMKVLETKCVDGWHWDKSISSCDTLEETRGLSSSIACARRDLREAEGEGFYLDFSSLSFSCWERHENRAAKSNSRNAARNLTTARRYTVARNLEKRFQQRTSSTADVLPTTKSWI
ncbi:hypothetical protein V1477_003968, partial [Vespula maculifrons]